MARGPLGIGSGNLMRGGQDKVAEKRRAAKAEALDKLKTRDGVLDELRRILKSDDSKEGTKKAAAEVLLDEYARASEGDNSCLMPCCQERDLRNVATWVDEQRLADTIAPRKLSTYEKSWLESMKAKIAPDKPAA